MSSHSVSNTTPPECCVPPTSVSKAEQAAEPAVTDRRSRGRYDSLDFIKGFLVLGMVVFHAVNYFSARSDTLLHYLKFVSGGFIFISGLILCPVYSAKWNTEPGTVTKRLLQRALKLFVLFTILNAAINLLAVRNFNKVQFGLSQFIENLGPIYTHGSGRLAAFEVLLPISYLLFLSPLLLCVLKKRRVAAPLLVLILLICSVLEFRLNNVTMLVIGLVGALIGAVVSPSQIGNPRHMKCSLPVLLFALLFLPLLRQTLLGYITYIIVVLKCAADLSALLPRENMINYLILECGRNVLFCYLLHIALLQIFFRTFSPNRDSGAIIAVGAILLTYLVLGLAVWISRVCKRHSKAFDAAFKLVFS